MTTYVSSSPFDHSTVTGFRNWINDFTTGLASVGLVQTTDTGQITTSSITSIPGVNTTSGYQIYRFNDSVQSSFPVFLKIEYGTNGVAAGPAIYVSVATGSSGAGSLTGTTLLARTTTGVLAYAPTTTTTAFPSYFCYNTSTGFLGWIFKDSSYSVSTMHSSFMIGRSCDSTGALTTSGVTAFVGNPTANVGVFQYAANNAGVATISGSQYYGINVGGRTTTRSGADLQLFPNWTAYPLIEPINWRCSIVANDFYPSAIINGGVSFTATIVGSTPHTYIALSTAAGYYDVSGSSINVPAMNWE